MKEDILFILIESNNHLSGQYIADKLSLSRNGIWKNINKLKELGYIIDTKPKVGYKLLNKYELLEYNLKYYLKELKYELHFLEQIDSTNTYLKTLNSSNRNNIVVAKEQINGRGRLGKKFVSTKNKGIYMSFSLSKNIDFNDLKVITSISAISICKAIKNLYNIDLGIKWINDLYYKNKKLAGILTEATIEAETSSLDTVIVGIGLNIYKNNDLDDELSSKVICLEDIINETNININLIIKEILTTFNDIFYKYQEDKDSKQVLKDYKERVILFNKDVNIKFKDGLKRGLVKDIDEEFRLLVTCNDQEIYLYNESIELIKGVDYE